MELHAAMGDHFDAIPHSETVQHALLCHGSSISGTQVALSMMTDLVAGIAKQLDHLAEVERLRLRYIPLYLLDSR